jgi:hypothetical protein
MTPVQAAAAVAVLASLLAAGIPTFVNNLQASRLAEPMDGLGKLAARASVLAAVSPVEVAYPSSAPLTPQVVPQGTTVRDEPGTWSHPTWRTLDFGFDVPHRFSFEFTSQLGQETSTFVAIAQGDLDADGNQSRFSLAGEVRRGAEPSVGALEMVREIE